MCARSEQVFWWCQRCCLWLSAGSSLFGWKCAHVHNCAITNWYNTNYISHFYLSLFTLGDVLTLVPVEKTEECVVFCTELKICTGAGQVELNKRWQRQHKAAARRIRFSPDGQCLYSATSNRGLTVWHSETSWPIWMKNSKTSENCLQNQYISTL